MFFESFFSHYNKNFIVADDSKNRKWYIFQSDGKQITLEYGEIVLELLNIYSDILADSDSARHKKIVRFCNRENLFSADDLDSIKTMLLEYKTEFSQLQKAISSDSVKAAVKFTLWQQFCFATRAGALNIVLSSCRESDNQYLQSDSYCDLVQQFLSDNLISCGVLLISNNPCNIYVADSFADAFYLDLLYTIMYGCDFKNHLALCDQCGRLYFTRSNNAKYCNSCMKGKNKKESPRYLHTLIYNTLRRRNADTDRFLKESNYYWSVVNGRKPKSRKLKSYRADIRTIEQYKEWLQSVKDGLQK